MADNNIHQSLTLTYELCVTEDGEEVIVEECTTERPFVFVTGLGFTFDAFEAQFTNLQTGDTFDFVIPKEEANGERDEEFVFDVPKSTFTVDGEFQSDVIYPGNIVPLLDAEGHRIQGMVVDVKEDAVTLDLNHPLAGKDLHFTGMVVEKRDATPDEVQGMLNLITGKGHCGGCHGHCSDCDDDCEGGCGGEGKCHGKGHDGGCHGKGNGKGHCHRK